MNSLLKCFGNREGFFAIVSICAILVGFGRDHSLLAKGTGQRAASITYHLIPEISEPPKGIVHPRELLNTSYTCLTAEDVADSISARGQAKNALGQSATQRKTQGQLVLQPFQARMDSLLMALEVQAESSRSSLKGIELSLLRQEGTMRANQLAILIVILVVVLNLLLLGIVILLGWRKSSGLDNKIAVAMQHLEKAAFDVRKSADESGHHMMTVLETMQEQVVQKTGYQLEKLSEKLDDVTVLVRESSRSVKESDRTEKQQASADLKGSQNPLAHFLEIYHRALAKDERARREIEDQITVYRLSISNYTQRLADRKLKPELRVDTSGDFLAAAPDLSHPGQYVLMPHYDVTITDAWYHSGAIGDIFICGNYKPGIPYSRYRVIRPAHCEKISDQIWRLTAQGELEV